MTNSAVTNLDQLGQGTPTPKSNTKCSYPSKFRGTMQPSWKMAHWCLDWPNHNTIELKFLRNKFDGCSRQMVSLELIGCIQPKLAQSKWKFGTWRGDTPWDPQAKCWYYDPKVPNEAIASPHPWAKLLVNDGETSSKQNDVPNEWMKKRHWKSEESAGEMLPASRMKLGQCKLRGNLRFQSCPIWQGVLANPKNWRRSCSPTTSQETGKLLYLPRMKMMDTDEFDLWPKSSSTNCWWSPMFQAARPDQGSLRRVLMFKRMPRTLLISEQSCSLSSCNTDRAMFVLHKWVCKTAASPRHQSYFLLRIPGQQANDSPEWTWGGTPDSFRFPQCATNNPRVELSTTVRGLLATVNIQLRQFRCFPISPIRLKFWTHDRYQWLDWCQSNATILHDTTGIVQSCCSTKLLWSSNFQHFTPWKNDAGICTSLRRRVPFSRLRRRRAFWRWSPFSRPRLCRALWRWCRKRFNKKLKP